MGIRKYRDFGTLGPRLFFTFASIVLAGGWIAFLSGQNENLLPGLITATVAAASIVYSLARAQEASKDQYTLTLIARRFDDGDYAKNVRIASDLGRSGRITPETGLTTLFEIEWSEGKRGGERMLAAYAIIPLLNYWEHVCTAYVDNRINRRIFEDLVQDLIRELVLRYPTVIGNMRRVDRSNMEHLCTVWFAIALETERQSVCRLLGDTPERLCADDQFRWQKFVDRP